LNGRNSMHHFNIKLAKRSLSIAIVLLFILLSVWFFDLSKIASALEKVLRRPDLVFYIILFYFLSFCLKAWAWRLYLLGRPAFLSCLLGILYSLFINHISPVKAGDLVRAGILSQREETIRFDEALHSVVILRILDILSLFLFTIIGLFLLDMNFSIPIWTVIVILIGGGILLYFIRKKFTAFFGRQMSLLRNAFSGMNGLFITILTVLSWVLEAVVLFGTVLAISEELSFLQAIWINSLTVGGQVFQITPGGIANYEAIMTFALGMNGFPLNDAYTIAVMTHGIKFLFSYLGGAFCLYYYPVSNVRIKNWTKQKRSVWR
jgi:glycosyltransferase AglD